MSTCYNNPEESSTTKINKHAPLGYSIFTHCSFDKSKSKLNYYRGEDCMTKFCKDLREHATKIINYEKKDMIPLTKKEEENYNNQKVCYICKKEIPVVFHNGSTYDYHFIIKELVKEFEGNFECLGENTEKYITFSVPIKKKIENKDIEITYRIKFIDSYRFMATSLSKLVDNLTEDIHGDKCVDCKSDLSYMKVTDEALIFRCFNCKKNYKNEINKELIKRFASTYKFCNNDLNKFVMLLRKGVYPYEYMDGWDKFNETSIPNKESFYSNLTMENISETDYRPANNVFKTFKLDNLGDYHDLYVRSNTLLFADVFENFRKACIKTYELDPMHFISLPGLAWQCHATLHSDMPLQSDMPLLPERIKIDKTQQLVCNLRDKKKYVVHISISKQTLDHGLKLKKVHRVIEFNQEAWLKKYIDMNIELRKKASNDFEKDFFKLMHNAVFGKMMENVRKHRDIKLVKTDHKRN